MVKWICAAVGLYLGGFLGAIAGYFLGAFIQGIMSGSKDNVFTSEQRAYGTGSNYAYGNGGYTQNRRQTVRTTDNPRTLFLNSLLEMSAYIIAADGRIMHSEMEVLRTFLRQNFDAGTAQACNERMLTIFEERKRMTQSQWRSRVMQSCRVVAMALPHEQRLQLLSFLAAICKADGHVDRTEINAMRDVALAMGLDVSVVDQLLSLGGTTLDDAYKVLGISPDATDDEVRRAYRKMALQYHPDRVATLGKDVQETAKRKFQEINDAKERIFKERGL
jgi:DnaJ like chaperone protein